MDYYCPTEPVALLAMVSIFAVACFAAWFGWWLRGFFDYIAGALSELRARRTAEPE